MPAQRKHVRAVFEGDGILKKSGSGQVVVDLGTSSVSQTRDFAKQLQAKGAAWADAPIARTRQAAQDGTLSVMVGAAPELYAAIEPLIRCFAADVTHCGEVGAGQVTKILNNMVLFETVNALAEAVAVQSTMASIRNYCWIRCRRVGRQLCAAQPRHEGDRARRFPERAFSTEYALKDLSYALELAGDAGIKIRGAELIGKILQEAIDAGSGDNYFPVIAKHIDELAHFGGGGGGEWGGGGLWIRAGALPRSPGITIREGHVQYASFASASWLVCTSSRLASILPSRAARSLAPAPKGMTDLLLLAQQARDQPLVERPALARQPQAEFAAVLRVLDALDELPLHQPRSRLG